MPGRVLRRYVIAGFLFTTAAGGAAIDRVGIARVYLSAAARTMAGSWWSFWHTSFDPGDFLTVEKPPGALWVQALSIKVFGFGGWQILWPSIFAAGIACAVVIHTVGKRHGATAAACVLAWFASTPGIVALSRSNNADIFVICLAVSGAAAWLRAVEHGKARWWVLSSVCIGVGILTKGLYITQVLPGFVLAAAWGGRGRLRRTALNAAASIAGMVVLGLSWAVWMDAHDRSQGPYVAHTAGNSAVEQLLGWGSLNGPRWTDAPGFGGTPGILRIFDIAGDQAYWMLPFSVLGMWTVARRVKKEPGAFHADGILWCGWLIASVLVFSFTGRVVHDYYTAVSAPAVVALAGIGVSDAVRRGSRIALGVAGAGIGAMHLVYAGRSGGVGSAIGAVVCAVAGVVILTSSNRRGWVRAAIGITALAVIPAVWSVRGVMQPSVEWNPVARVGEEVWVNHDLIPEEFYEIAERDTQRGRWLFAVPTYGYAEHAVAQGKPVLAAGGFNAATGGSFSLARLEELLGEGDLRYVVSGAVHPYEPEVQQYLEQRCAVEAEQGSLQLRRC